MWLLVTPFFAPKLNLSLRNSPPHPHTPLSTVQSLLLRLCDLRALLHDLHAFGQDQLNVARVGHVRIDLQPVTISDSDPRNPTTFDSGLDSRRVLDIHDHEHGRCDGAAWVPG